MSERIAYGKKFIKDYDITIPVVFDGMDDKFNERMSAWPLQLYIITTDRKIAYYEPEEENGIQIDTRVDHIKEYLRSIL